MKDERDGTPYTGDGESTTAETTEGVGTTPFDLHPSSLVLVREATLDDAPGLARVHVESWRTSYPGILPEDAIAARTYELREQQWRYNLRLEDDNVINLAAIHPQDGIVGFASGGPERGEDPDYTGELYGIYLLQAHQRKGLGGRLTRSVAEWLLQQGHSSMLVWTLEHNPSRRFYERLGGVYLYEKPYEIRGYTFTQVAYGWSDLRSTLLADAQER